jgi:hypothetical protein
MMRRTSLKRKEKRNKKNSLERKKKDKLELLLKSIRYSKKK